MPETPVENTVASILAWFKEAIPHPSQRNLRAQLGTHFEEVVEQLQAMRLLSVNGLDVGFNATLTLDQLASGLKDHKVLVNIEPTERKEVLDALCDQIVTAVGVAHILGMDIVGALAEVNRANWSKFVDGKPVFAASGKIAKGPDWRKEDLTPFLAPVNYELLED